MKEEKGQAKKVAKTSKSKSTPRSASYRAKNSTKKPSKNTNKKQTIPTDIDLPVEKETEIKAPKKSKEIEEEIALTQEIETIIDEDVFEEENIPEPKEELEIEPPEVEEEKIEEPKEEPKSEPKEKEAPKAKEDPKEEVKPEPKEKEAPKAKEDPKEEVKPKSASKKKTEKEDSDEPPKEESISKKNKSKPIIMFMIILLILAGLGFAALKLFGKEDSILSNNTQIKSIIVTNYDKENNLIDIVITPTTNQKACALVDSEDKTGEYVELQNNECHLQVSLDKQYIYFKDGLNIESKKLEVDNFVVEFDLKEKYYQPTSSTINIASNMIVVGNPNVEIRTDENILEVTDTDLIGKGEGTTKVQFVLYDKLLKEIEVTITHLIVSAPKEFDLKKTYLTCEQYTTEEAALLDEILEARIEEAGYGTRAGAVAAARFLTLEFPNRISYYWENGRLYYTGTHYVDGEGRYYHKGLYLDKTKIDQLVEGAHLRGPVIWGCNMVSYEKDPPYFYPGRQYPNGLDCSGFVSWSLLNGGFDVGDRGAGHLEFDKDLTDLGEFRPLNKEIINSGKIRVGDLFNVFGHISILVGEDEDHYYIAESLNAYGGVVLRTYTKTNVLKYFSYVVLMDELYKEDGNLTNLWYE